MIFLFSISYFLYFLFPNFYFSGVEIWRTGASWPIENDD